MVDVKKGSTDARLRALEEARVLQGQTAAVLDGLRGAGRGVGELAEAFTIFDARLRVLELESTSRTADVMGVTTAVTDKRRAVELATARTV